MGKVSKAIDVLTANGVKLTLVDVGASLEPFAPFAPLLVDILSCLQQCDIYE